MFGRRAGQVVSKDELMDLVWPDVVVGEGSLTQAIADVRRALGDTEHRLVRNVARRGYMLVPGGGADDAPTAVDRRHAARRRGRRRGERLARRRPAWRPRQRVDAPAWRRRHRPRYRGDLQR